MKKSLLILLIMLWVVVSIQTQHDEELFLQAGESYKQQMPAKALELYKEIKDKSWLVWYNMGLSAYQAEQLFDALVYWQRALKNVPTYRDYGMIDSAIIKAQEKLHSEQPSTWLTTPVNFLLQVRLLLPLIVWQLLLLLLWIALLINGVVWLQRKQYVMMGGLLCIMISVGTIVFVDYYIAHTTFVVVKDISAKMFIGPNESFSSKVSIKAGQILKLVELRNDWYKVQSGLAQGWIMASAVEIV